MLPEETSIADSGESQTQSPGDQVPVETQSLPVYESNDLLRGTREIVIRHHGEVYRLRLTRNNKLILNK